MNRNQLTEKIANELAAIRDITPEEKVPMSMPGYSTLFQALSILSTTRDAEAVGNPLVKAGVKFLASDGNTLITVDNLSDARAFIADADPIDVRLFGAAIVMVDADNDEYAIIG